MSAPAAGAPAGASIFKPRDRKYGQRQPIWLKRDKFARHGDALLLAALAVEPLERCVAVVRYMLALLADMLRPGGPDPDDLPITTLGYHHVTVRQLGGGSRTAGRPAAAAAAAAAGAATAPGATGGGGGGGPSIPRVHVQEVLSFDPNEGPKDIQVATPGSGPPVAVASLRIDPRVNVKAKRLGRDVSVKVRLQGGGHVALQPPAGASAAADAQPQEQYTVVLPNLVLRGNLPYAARPEFKGELIVQCPSTGLMASLTFKEEGAVKGVLEKLQPQQPQAARGHQGAGSGSLVGSFSGSGAAAGGAGNLSSMYGTIGSFAGSLYDSIQITCPELGLEGTLHSESPPTPGLPPLSQLMDLSRPGPQQLPRLWAALHDALLYNDPKQVSGGKAADEVSRRLASGLHALFVEGGGAAAGGGAGVGGGAAAAGGGAATAASVAGGVGGGATDPSAGAAGGDSDSDFEAAARDEGDAAEDPRDVPPSYKAQHAAGRRLFWHLQYTLLATEAAPVAPLAPGAADALPAGARQAA